MLLISEKSLAANIITVYRFYERCRAAKVLNREKHGTTWSVVVLEWVLVL